MAFLNDLHRGPPLDIIENDSLDAQGFTGWTEYSQMSFLLKNLGLIDKECKTTKTYHDYRTYTKPKNRKAFLQVLVKKCYPDIFKQTNMAWTMQPAQLKRLFTNAHSPKTRTSLKPEVVNDMADVFFTLCTFCKHEERDDADTKALKEGLESVARSISPQEEDQLRQSIFCFSIEAYKAAVVVGWTAIVHYLGCYLFTDGFEQLKKCKLPIMARGKKVRFRVNDLTALLEKHTDEAIVEAVKTTYQAKTNKLLDKNLPTDLTNLRKQRNECAHASANNPTRDIAKSFFLTCYSVIKKLDKKRVEQFYAAKTSVSPALKKTLLDSGCSCLQLTTPATFRLKVRFESRAMIILE